MKIISVFINKKLACIADEINYKTPLALSRMLGVIR